MIKGDLDGIITTVGGAQEQTEAKIFFFLIFSFCGSAGLSVVPGGGVAEVAGVQHPPFKETFVVFVLSRASEHTQRHKSHSLSLALSDTQTHTRKSPGVCEMRTTDQWYETIPLISSQKITFLFFKIKLALWFNQAHLCINVR